jgi:hypothetical protein
MKFLRNVAGYTSNFQIMNMKLKKNETYVILILTF